MPMDRSKRVGSVPRVNKDGASGRTGNALGPQHMGGNPAGRAQVAGQATSASGEYKARGNRMGTRTGLELTGPIPAGAFKQNLAGQTVDFKLYFKGYATTAGTWVLTSAPAGMTLNSTTGILSGTPTTVAAGTPNLTVLGPTGTKPTSLVVPWSWGVTA